ncbi:phosphotransferase [Nonomuraea purpurea]|uniref:Phosphotransferase n=1 Tax=Nonomuraea purpurea TaxID=1849276 RepID=A0ABV8GBW9_9ACTN
MRNILDRWFPDVEPERLAVRRGQFHQVVVGPDRVVCLPRTPAAATRLPERAAVLRLLAGLGDLGVPVPRPLESGGEEYLVLSRVPGEPLEAFADVATAEAVAARYAELLATGAGRSRHRRTGLPPGRLQRAEGEGGARQAGVGRCSTVAR